MSERTINLLENKGAAPKNCGQARNVVENKGG
jgi:hypothetical protein